MTLDVHPKTEDTSEPNPKSTPGAHFGSTGPLDHLNGGSPHPNSMPPVSIPHNSFSHSPYPPSYLNNYGAQMDAAAGYHPTAQGYPFSAMNPSNSPYSPYGPSAYSPASRMSGYGQPDPYQSSVTSLMNSKVMSDR